MSTFTEMGSITYVTETCYKCGVYFAMVSHFHNERRTNGGEFWCPNGHSQVYSKSTVQALREQLDVKERELRASKCQTLEEKNLRESAERKPKRVKRGVCPCCNRSFQNLARHMEMKHPEKNP